MEAEHLGTNFDEHPGFVVEGLLPLIALKGRIRRQPEMGIWGRTLFGFS